MQRYRQFSIKDHQFHVQIIPRLTENHRKMFVLSQKKRSWTCIDVKLKKKQKLTALLDTGSDITIIGSVLARKLKWKIFPLELGNVKAANGDDILLSSIAYVTLRVGTQEIDSEVLISPDTTGLILEIDWMEENECVFSCKEKEVCVN